MDVFYEHLEEFAHQDAGIASLPGRNRVGRWVVNRHRLKRLAAGAIFASTAGMVAPILNLQRIHAHQSVLTARVAWALVYQTQSALNRRTHHVSRLQV